MQAGREAVQPAAGDDGGDGDEDDNDDDDVPGAGAGAGAGPLLAVPGPPGGAAGRGGCGHGGAVPGVAPHRGHARPGLPCLLLP